ncbi:MAG: hypothetical protein AAF667_12605 [Pseudomonadota bacterium]
MDGETFPAVFVDDVQRLERFRAYFLWIEGGYHAALGAAVAQGDVAFDPDQCQATARHLFAV